MLQRIYSRICSFKRFSLILFTFLGITQYGSGQWQAVTFKNTITDTLYYLNDDTAIRNFTKISFPEYYTYEKPCSRGIDLLNGYVFHSGEGNVLWYKKLADAFDLNKDTLACKFQLFTKHVKSYTIYVYSKLNNSWGSKSVELKNDGFNEPVITLFSTLKKVTDSGELKLLNSNASALKTDSSSCIQISVNNASAGAEFIVGDLIIGHYKQQVVNVDNPFFNTVLKTHSSINSHSFAYPSFVSNTIHSSPDFFFNPTLNGYIALKAVNDPANAMDEKQELQILKDILLLSFEKYPYFKEYAIDKTNTKKEFLSTWQKNENLPYCQLIDTIAKFIEQRFADGHFRLVNSSKCKIQTNKPPLVKSPVRIYAINGSIYISAVFDTLYKIQPGSLITAIDHIPSKRMFDSLQKKININSNYVNRSASMDVSMLLERPSYDSVLIEYTNNGQQGSAFIKFNRPLKIPSNFIPVHAEYRNYENGNVSYFRINSWFLDVYSRFINNREPMEKSNTIIIDLRGNGGGELLSSMRLFSMFIDTPKVYSIAQELSTNNKGNLVINPNASVKLSGKQVILLGDASTACASESFIAAMKQLPNVVYISADDRTMGMIASRYDIHFPSGYYLTTDAVSEKIYMYNGKVIENIGVKPDIKVNISNIADLRPYEDKVLRTALNVAKNFKNN